VAERLLDDLAPAGAWFDGTMRFCDPACGGGAFLLPVARRIADHLKVAGGSASDLARCLIGIDIDPGGLAITRAALDALTNDRFGETARWDLSSCCSRWARIAGWTMGTSGRVGLPVGPL
jgi:hypothetical protein